MPESVHSPTVVVGVGGAGIDIVETVHETIETKQLNPDEFLFLGIDSRDIRELDIKGWNKRTTVLSWSEQDVWERKFENYHYLDEDDERPPKEGGVQRKRPLARALLDDEENISKLISDLTLAIDEFGSGHDTIDIWLVNSLGGGTGSGTLPMMLGLIQWLAEAEFDPNINVYGLASVPQLDVKPDTDFPPTIDSDAVPNAFGALSELRNLVDLTAYDGSEVEIKIQLNTDSVDLFKLIDENAPISRESLEGFYLTGIDEEQISSDSGGYARQIEELATSTILAYATLDENFPDPDNDSLKDRILHTNDLVEYRFPYGDAAEFVEQTARHQRLEEDDEALEGVRERFQSNKEYVDTVSQIRGSIDADQIETLFKYCEQQVEEIDDDLLQHLTKDGIQERAEEMVSVDADAATNLKTEFDRTRNDLEKISEDHRPPAPGTWQQDDDESESSTPEERIIKYLFFVALYQRVSKRRNSVRQKMEDKIDEVWSEIRDDIDDDYEEAYRQHQEYAQKWDEVLYDAVNERIDDLFEGGIIFDKTERAEELQDLRDEVEDAKDEYENLENVRANVDDLRTTFHGDLRNLVEWYADQIGSIKDQREEIGESLDTSQKLLKQSREEITEGIEPGAKFASIPLNDPETLVNEYFTDEEGDVIGKLEELVDQYTDVLADRYERFVDTEQYDDFAEIDPYTRYRMAAEQYLRENVVISEYAQKGIVDSDQIRSDLRDLVEELEERVADRGSIENALILPVRNPDDDWLAIIEEDSYNGIISGGQMSSANISKSRGSWELGGGLQFFFCNPDVALDDASEYNTLREWYASGQLTDVLDTKAESAEEAVNFAYPELVDFVEPAREVGDDVTTDD